MHGRIGKAEARLRVDPLHQRFVRAPHFGNAERVRLGQPQVNMDPVSAGDDAGR